MPRISNYKIAIGLPVTWSMVSTPFFLTFLVMEKPECILLYQTNGQLDDLRNGIVRDAQANACTHLAMMDTDQVYPLDTITKLLRHNLPVVGALVHRRYPPFDALMFRGKINSFARVEEWDKDSLVKVDATGTGCLLIRMDVFDKIKEPWFKFMPNPDSNVGGIVGEDFYFCNKVREADIPIYVDTSVEVAHLSTNLAVTGETRKLYSYMKKIKEEEESKDAMMNQVHETDKREEIRRH